MTRDERRAVVEFLYRARAALVRGETVALDPRDSVQRAALKALLGQSGSQLERYDGAIECVRLAMAPRDGAAEAMADGELPDDEDVGEAIPGAEELP